MSNFANTKSMVLDKAVAASSDITNGRSLMYYSTSSMKIVFPIYSFGKVIVNGIGGATLSSYSGTPSTDANLMQFGTTNYINW